MTPSTFDCYACGALVLPGQVTCTSCGVSLSREAAHVHERLAAADARATWWRQATAICGIAAFMLGAGATAAVERPSDTRPATNTIADVRLSREQLNDVFVREIQKTVKVPMTGWLTGPDSSFIVELAPPSRQDITTMLWESMTPSERTQVMAFISIAYTRSLVAAGVPVDLHVGHPVVALQYHGANHPIAVRTKDGAISLYRTGYEGVALAGAPAAAPATAKTP